jgi:hypothetical protein
MIYKKTILQITIITSCIALALHAELPLTHIKGLAEPFRKSKQTITAAQPAAEQVTPTAEAAPAATAAIIMADQQNPAQENTIDDNIFSPIYGALAWHSPYLLNLWQNDSESATASLVQQLFNLQFDGVTFDVSGIPGNTISHLSCENLGYIIGLLYNYEQAMNKYAKQIAENSALLQAEQAHQGEASPRAEQQRTPSPLSAASPHSKQTGKKSPQPISPFQEKQREFAKYKNEEPLRIKKELFDKLATYLNTINPELVKQNIITYYSSQIAHLEADITREQAQAKIQALQRKKADLESKLAAEQAPGSVKLTAYNEGRRAFVKDIIGSMLDTRYLPHNTILLLLSCMWKKANSYTAIMHYMYGVYSAIDNKTALFTDAIATQLNQFDQAISYEAFASILMPLINQPPYTSTEYQALIERTSQELYTNLADYAFAFVGFDIFDDTATLLPPEVSMSISVQYGTTIFSDCGETSLLNFFTAILYNPMEKRWNNQLLDAINADAGLKQFFIDFAPSTLNTQVAHNRWATVVSNKANVEYIRTNKCEIGAGIDNMLKVIAALIPGANTFDDLARILNSNGIQIVFNAPTGLNKYGQIGIQLTKNTEQITLAWLFNPDHFLLSFPPKTIKNDPRIRVLQATPFNNAITSDIVLRSILMHYDVQSLNTLQITHYYQAFIYEIQSPEYLLKIINCIADLQESILYKIPLMRSLYNTLSHKQITEHDQDMYQRVFWRIINTTTINPEIIVLEKDIADTTDIQKKYYIKRLLSQTITATIAAKIQKILYTIRGDYDKISIIMDILTQEPTLIIQQLYASIIPIIGTIQDDAGKMDIIKAILEQDPTTDIVQQLYAATKSMVRTIRRGRDKAEIRRLLSRKDQSIPVVQELLQATQ